MLPSPGSVLAPVENPPDLPVVPNLYDVKLFSLVSHFLLRRLSDLLRTSNQLLGL